ncbi:methylenetetrahydrofolate reductase [NAD(P)H] [Aerosticca soli]|nr:methylenetetrahydrofolate reductase [NAD(P)H] [Aerosticca soli]MDI3262713.1 methylenetetrahydrofolate reductase [NAD(P)H] [Fulvimonas sp.]
MPSLSFEFFPPKTAQQREQLDQTVTKLAAFGPDYVSVTFGAGGSTLNYTRETLAHLKHMHGLEVAPHLSCMGGTREEIAALLDDYRAAGYRRLVALRGDLPSGMASPGDFRYAAELVRFVRERTGDHFRIEVAAYPETHPQAADALVDLEHFRAKIAAGADGAITQYFYNPDAYFRFVADVRRLGVSVPIVPGIMPIANFSQLTRFSASCGAEIPRWIAKRMQALGDDAQAIRELGAELVAQLCRQLLEGGAPGLHFYTLNRARPTMAVLERLR